VAKQAGVIFNYACFGRKNADKLLIATQFDSKKQHWLKSFFMIDGSLKQTKILSS
jgi:hypothetical protein